jgi:hypothetical protein
MLGEWEYNQTMAKINFGNWSKGAWAAALLEADEFLTFGTSVVPPYTKDSIVGILRDHKPAYWNDKYDLSDSQIKELSETDVIPKAVEKAWHCYHLLRQNG